MLRLWWGTLIIILILTSMSADAQTSGDLKQKYTLLENGRYLVRPNVILTVTFDKNGQACRMQIDPQKLSTPNQYLIEVMPSKVAHEIIDELVPVSNRGKVLSRSSFNAGCSGMAITLYENVEISIAFTCAPNGGGVTSASVIWRKSKCWEEYQRKPPA